MTDGRSLEQLQPLVGRWTTEARHPAFPGQVFPGTAEFEWLDGQRFLICRSHTDHPDFPDAVSVIGFMDRDRADVPSSAPPATRPAMHYFDTRGVFRVYEIDLDDGAWRWSREVPGFSQRFTGTFSDDGNSIDGRSQLRRDDVHWEDDLQLTYRRKA